MTQADLYNYTKRCTKNHNDLGINFVLHLKATQGEKGLIQNCMLQSSQKDFCLVLICVVCMNAYVHISLPNELMNTLIFLY